MIDARKRPTRLVISGISCSGKTELSRLIARQTGEWKYVDSDDYHSEEFKKSKKPATEEYRRQWLDRVVKNLRPLVRSAQPFVLACSALTHEARARLLSVDPDLLLGILDIPPDVAMKRSLDREHWFKSHLLADQFERFQAPHPHPRLRRFDGTRPLDELTGEVVDWVRRTETKRSAPKLRVAIFSSHYWGLCLIRECVFGMSRDTVQLVGVATDDPRSNHCNAKRRIWQFMPADWEAAVVPEEAWCYGIGAYRGPISDNRFRNRFLADWRPDVCLMGIFGQRIDRWMCEQTRIGFFNFHPTVAEGFWPAYPGPEAFKRILSDRCHQFHIAMHGVTEKFDDGPLVAFSDPIPIAPGMSCRDMAIASGMPMARFAAEQIRNFSISS